MRPVLILVSTSILAGGVWFAACTSDDSAASPSGPQLFGAEEAGSGGGASSSTPATDSSAGSADSGLGAETGTTDASDAGSSDAGKGADGDAAAASCALDAGAIVPAKFDFAATAATLNGGKGQVLTAHVCDTVVWTNDDNGMTHGVESTGGGFTFNTGTVTGTVAGAAFPGIQFATAGTFTYQCSIHGNMMTGQITVQ